jgi:pimeloyl-ACP methyl ester carboxylesterase
MTERLPIVYVRGFAGDTSGINKVVTDPFYGFNEGSTHVRVGRDGEPLFYQFESPLLRLHLDEGYQILVDGGQMAYLERADRIPPDSIWIHRFYDVSASTWAEEPAAFSLERAAEDLLLLIEKLKDKSGARAVYLVAHSMGGLICRCLLQNIIPDQRPDHQATDYVDKFVTLGTPHAGIHFAGPLGFLERLRDATGFKGADIFGPERMYQYLTPAGRRDPAGPPEGWRAEEMPEGEGHFPKDRLLCIVGTNPKDYDVAFGLSAVAVGAKSDGLVQIEKAFVPGARHAFVHRSHSGPFGLVNSEESYQNLRRFLFGDLEVQADLVGHRRPPGDTGGDELVWQAEVRLSVRGVAIVMHEQLAAHWCPIQLNIPRVEDTADTPQPLVTAFLSSKLPRPEDSKPMRYGLHLRILSLRERDRIFSFGDHLEQVGDFDDILVVDVGLQDARPRAWAEWNSQIPGSLRTYEPTGVPLQDQEPAPGTWIADVALPATARPILGENAKIRLTVTART